MPQERKTFLFDHTNGFEPQIREPEPVEPIIVEPVEPVPPIVVEPVPPVEPIVEPVEPVEPDPADPPVEPVEPEPIDPAEPIDPINPPVEPVEPVEPPAEPVEPVETDNFYVAAVARMKSQGDLPEDFELTEDMDDDAASDAIYENFHATMSKDSQQEYMDQFKEELTSNGWNQDTLAYAKMLQNGVRPEDISRVVDYGAMASTDIADFSDDQNADFARKMYHDRGFKKKEIERIITTAEVDGELSSLGEEAVTYFGEKRDINVENLKVQAQQNQDAYRQAEQHRLGVVSNVFNNKQIGDMQLTDDMLDTFEQGVFNKTVPVQTDNGIVNVSQLEQFQHELQNNYELQLWAYAKYQFRDQEAQTYAAAAQVAAEQQQLVKWGKKVKRTGKPVDPAKPQPITAATHGGKGGAGFEYDAATGAFIPLKKQ